jgi:hypothetical protein
VTPPFDFDPRAGFFCSGLCPTLFHSRQIISFPAVIAAAEEIDKSVSSARTRGALGRALDAIDWEQAIRLTRTSASSPMSSTSENFPTTITNSPEVAGIVPQRPVDAGFKIGGTGVETQKEPHDAEGRPGRGH